MTSSAGLRSKVQAKDDRDNFSDMFYIPTKNRFDSLKKLHANSSETQEDAPNGLAGKDTAMAVPRTERMQTIQTNKVKSTKRSWLVVENTNTLSNKELSNTTEAKHTPVTTNNKTGVITESIAQTNTQQVATLRDGGLRFQPPPESGLAFNSVLPDHTSSTYDREEKIPLYVWNQKE